MSVDGNTVLAEALKNQGVEYVFGIVGWPIVEVAMSIQSVGIKYVGMRNEQAAVYAAQIIGYLTKRPLIVISGAGESEQESMGTFQEYHQVDSASLHCKYAARPSSVERIPFYVEKAVRTSIFGRPGACYLDIPGDMLARQVPIKNVQLVDTCPLPPRTLSDNNDIRKALDLIANAQRPLVIIGKGAAYSQAEYAIHEFVIGHKLPFLSTPMGKGLLPDDHPLCVSSARTRALQHADVILLLGARLNWILHFGQSPRFSRDVKFIQIDIHAEELNNGVPAAVALHGDVNCVIKQMNQEVKSKPGTFEFNPNSAWWRMLHEKIEENMKSTQIENLLPRDVILVSEGSNTMDISRTMFNNSLPRHRLDAGTFGTMGVGAGFAVAAAIWCRDHHPNKRVVCLQGDSAFGFGGMEVETACRYRLPIIFIIINNSGILYGLHKESYDETADGDLTTGILPTALTPNAHYEKIIEAFGGNGYHVETREELKASLGWCLKSNKTSLINVIIDPASAKKKQEFQWLTSKI
ncbi:hypothetical protein LSH36_16g00003 [Paralvinella palmiformis]|uniref:2-hydroxyacyl-CoA lyase n=1 Tax=Paralvinella palmiformis TaxID=53620 RepID=A0AAD9KD28_9ANNE|nr:hypothetical protein LSH36_16g00003 [Paralvinella palmiformis]